MSVYVTRNVYDGFRTKKHTLKYILLALAYFSDESGYCHPSQGVIADKCCISISSVKRALHELHELGEIRIKTTGRGRWMWTSYFLDKYAASVHQIDRATQNKMRKHQSIGSNAHPIMESEVKTNGFSLPRNGVRMNENWVQDERPLVSNSKEEVASGILSVELNFKFGDQHSKERRMEMYQVLIRHGASQTRKNLESFLDLATSDFGYEDAFVCSYLDDIDAIKRKDQPEEFQDILGAIFRSQLPIELLTIKNSRHSNFTVDKGEGSGNA